MSHAFLTALEDSGSVGPGTGWQPAPLVIEDDAGTLLAALPGYLKGHSQGEYVFDHGWADAWQRAGGDYYPKYQISAPFTPASGPRLLLADPLFAAPLLAAAEQLVDGNGWSGAHATFVEPAQHEAFEQAGWLRRERAEAAAGVEIRTLCGGDIRPEHWDAFWLFYQDTGARKWGSPYLTREAFDLIGERMGDDVLLMLAFDEGRAIAGALHVIGQDALYGRYWGCVVDKPFLHFELCYYRAIDEAIVRGLARVEAGAQGGHKLVRGYEPVATTSFHYIADPGFRRAVADFLAQERRGVSMEQIHLARHTPFRKG